MDNEVTALLIADVDMQAEPNHRFFHVVDYVAERVDRLDFVSFQNAYGGEPTSLPRKIIRTVHNLLFDRRQQWQEGRVHYTVIRHLKLPQTLRNLIGEFWTYRILPSHIRHGHYTFCIYSHPHNALIIRNLKQRGLFDHLYYDDCDYFPAGPDAVNPLAQRILAWKERVVMRTAERVFSVSRPLADLRRSMGARNVHVSPNGVPVRMFADGQADGDHPPTLMYVGLLAQEWLISPVIAAMPLIRDHVPDARLVIGGYGDHLSELKQQVESLGLQNCVTFTGRLPYTAVPDLLAAADAAVAIFANRPFNVYACHLKIREYIAAGLPVICSRLGEAEQLIADADAGILIDESSPESIAAAAVRLLQDDALRARYAANARAYAHWLDWSETLAPIGEHIVGSAAAHKQPIAT